MATQNEEGQLIKQDFDYEEVIMDLATENRDQRIYISKLESIVRNLNVKLLEAKK